MALTKTDVKQARHGSIVARAGHSLGLAVRQRRPPAARPTRRRRWWIIVGLAMALASWPIPAVTDGAASTPYGTSGAPFTTYLPVVFNGYGGCRVVPTLISPANGSVLTTRIPLFIWNDGSDPIATRSSMQLARDAAFAHGASSVRGGIEGEWRFRFPANLNEATTYYWRAWLTCGNLQGPYSEVWSFTTGSGGTVLPAPALVAPANESAVPTTVVTLRWAPVPGAVEYLLFWGTADHPGSSYNEVSGEQFELELSANTTYEWWVNARNDYAISADSETWQFTTPASAASAAADDAGSGPVVDDGRGTVATHHEERP